MGYSHIIVDSLESICKSEGVTAMTLEVKSFKYSSAKNFMKIMDLKLKELEKVITKIIEKMDL